MQLTPEEDALAYLANKAHAHALDEIAGKILTGEAPVSDQSPQAIAAAMIARNEHLLCPAPERVIVKGGPGTLEFGGNRMTFSQIEVYERSRHYGARYIP